MKETSLFRHDSQYCLSRINMLLCLWMLFRYRVACLRVIQGRATRKSNALDSLGITACHLFGFPLTSYLPRLYDQHKVSAIHYTGCFYSVSCGQTLLTSSTNRHSSVGRLKDTDSKNARFLILERIYVSTIIYLYHNFLMRASLFVTHVSTMSQKGLWKACTFTGA